MPSLTDLFNPTFLMFLGILVLVVALLVVYFESKMREQNHKITSMLSLVSSLAEELNGIKFGLNHLSMRGGIEPAHFFTQNHLAQNENSQLETKLIAVSDDEDEDDDGDYEDDVDDSDDDDSADLDDDEDEDKDDDNEDEDDDKDIVSRYEELDLNESSDVKVLKLNINSNISEEVEDFEIEDFNDDLSQGESISSKTSVLSLKELTNEENEDKSNIILQSDFKKISINLEEQLDSHDYKKLQLTKLRTIVSEKGLVVDSSKLKKNELLKLLGVE